MFFAKFKFEKSCIDKIIEKIKENTVKYPNEILLCNGKQVNTKTDKEWLFKLKEYYNFVPTSALIRKKLRSEICNWKKIVI